MNWINILLMIVYLACRKRISVTGMLTGMNPSKAGMNLSKPGRTLLSCFVEWAPVPQNIIITIPYFLMHWIPWIFLPYFRNTRLKLLLWNTSRLNSCICLWSRFGKFILNEWFCKFDIVEYISIYVCKWLCNVYVFVYVDFNASISHARFIFSDYLSAMAMLILLTHCSLLTSHGNRDLGKHWLR